MLRGRRVAEVAESQSRRGNDALLRGLLWCRARACAIALSVQTMETLVARAGKIIREFWLPRSRCAQTKTRGKKNNPRDRRERARDRDGERKRERDTAGVNLLFACTRSRVGWIVDGICERAKERGPVLSRFLLLFAARLNLTNRKPGRCWPELPPFWSLVARLQFAGLAATRCPDCSGCSGWHSLPHLSATLAPHRLQRPGWPLSHPHPPCSVFVHSTARPGDLAQWATPRPQQTSGHHRTLTVLSLAPIRHSPARCWLRLATRITAGRSPAVSISPGSFLASSCGTPHVSLSPRQCDRTRSNCITL